MSCVCDQFDTLRALKVNYNKRNESDGYTFMSFITNCIFITGGVRAAYLHTCDHIESELGKIKLDDSILFDRYCNQLVTTSFPYKNSKLCMLYNRNGDTGALMPIISDLAAKIQLGTGEQGELDRLIGAVLGYHCARNIHDMPGNNVGYSLNVSFPTMDKTFQILAYGCPISNFAQHAYYARRLFKMHFIMKQYLEDIGLNLSITTKIKSR